MHISLKFDFQLTLNTQIPRLTPAWDTFGFISNVVTNFCKQIPVRSSLQLQLLSRRSQFWLPIDSKYTDPQISKCMHFETGSGYQLIKLRHQTQTYLDSCGILALMGLAISCDVVLQVTREAFAKYVKVVKRSLSEAAAYEAARTAGVPMDAAAQHARPGSLTSLSLTNPGSPIPSPPPPPPPPPSSPALPCWGTFIE